MTVTLAPTFARSLLRAVDDPADMPVHLLFNELWQSAPPELVDAYVRQLDREPFRSFVADGHYPEPTSLERLDICPPGSYGEAVRDFIVDNGLQANLATDYRTFHEILAAGGMLDGMPEPVRYAVLRGFQLHDYIHVVTGFGPSARDEIALQAFCLAQLQFPYFAMWISLVTTRMTYVDPDSIVGLMDAITAGWRFGRDVDNLQVIRWEERIDEPLVDVRLAHGIDPAGRRPAVNG